MNLYIFYPAIALLPSAFIAILLKQRERAHAIKALEPPIGTDEKFLRSPGDSAFRKKTEFDQKILENLLPIFLSPPCLLTAYLSVPTTQRSSPGFWILWVMVLPIYGCFLIRGFRQLGRLYDNRQKWFLGFRGERAVGEYCVFATELEAQKEIVDNMMTRLREFLDGHRDYEDAITVEEYVVPVFVHEDGTITDADGNCFSPHPE